MKPSPLTLSLFKGEGEKQQSWAEMENELVERTFIQVVKEMGFIE